MSMATANATAFTNTRQSVKIKNLGWNINNAPSFPTETGHWAKPARFLAASDLTHRNFKKDLVTFLNSCGEGSTRHTYSALHGCGLAFGLTGAVEA